MKIISWNVNGFRSSLKGTFLDTFNALDADIYCLQETKLQAGEGSIDVPGFIQYWNCAERRGYGGTAFLSLREPDAVYHGINHDLLDAEGRIIRAEFDDFVLINCYSPHVGTDLSRLEERMKWDASLLETMLAYDREKPVILCGDLNAAYNDADLQGKGQGMHVPGYTQEERQGLAAILQSGFVDAYRYFHPDEKAGAFAYRKGIRGVGLDYFIVSQRLMAKVVDCRVHNRVKGSDHWPLELIFQE